MSSMSSSPKAPPGRVPAGESSGGGSSPDVRPVRRPAVKRVEAIAASIASAGVAAPLPTATDEPET